MENKYWDGITSIYNKQREKGVSKYGQVLEDNTVLDKEEVITYLQEELIDGLMYCEHLKTKNELDEYQKLALRTANAKDKKEMLTNGVMGLNGEAGEVIDIVKKHLFQGHELDKEKLLDELGDCLWYIAVTASAINKDLSEVANHNIDKLKKRYPEGFDSEKSINRVE